MAETAFERLEIAIEGTPGTAPAAPTHHLLMAGELDIDDEVYEDTTPVGSLAGLNRTETIWTQGALNPTGSMDVLTLPVLCEIALRGGVTPSTPTGATLARLWEYVRHVTSPDNTKSGTVWWGDPGDQTYRATFMKITELGLSGDASGGEAAQQSFAAFTQTVLPVTTPTLSTTALSALMIAGMMELWVDTGASPIGTTPVVGQLVSADVTIPTATGPKRTATGPEGGTTYSRVGRGRATPVMALAIDMVDQVQFNHYRNSNYLKVRLRYNGPLIEAGFRHFVEVDMYGKFRSPNWGVLGDTNRTLEVELAGWREASINSDVVVRIQNNKPTL